jgi:hypothetical protein
MTTKSKGLEAAFNNAIVYGFEPSVYNCHVKYRPGGAEALSLDSPTCTEWPYHRIPRAIL